MALASPSIAVVRDDSDRLAAVVTHLLRNANIPVIEIRTGTLSSVPVCLSEDIFLLDQQPVAGILFRAYPDASFSEGFEVEDSLFCNAELSATWLAAINLRSVLAINGYDAMAWFEGLRWTIWRQRLLGAGIAVSPFMFGSSPSQQRSMWYTYAGAWIADQGEYGDVHQILGSAISPSQHKQASLIVGGSVTDGEQSAAVSDTAAVLSKYGVTVARICTDEEDRILAVDTLPLLAEQHVIERSARVLVELYHDHLSDW